jgi:diaminopimelate epimerase
MLERYFLVKKYLFNKIIIKRLKMINFTKMHGLGNDYIYINMLEDKNYIPSDKISIFTRYVSNRNFGIGSDGVILIKPSKIADFKMEIYNADGSKAEMCGNGIRCFGKFLYDNKITTKRLIKVETLAGIKTLELILKDDKVYEVKVNMGKPIVLQKDLTFNIQNIEIKGTYISIGNPHFVIFVDNLENLDISKYRTANRKS